MSAVRECPSQTAAALLLVVLLVGLAALAGVTSTAPVAATAPAARVAMTPGPASGSLTISPNPDDVGISASFDGSGACLALVGSCSYTYTGLPAGCSSSNSSSFSCTPSASGQFDVNVTANWGCPVCLSNSATATFTVNSYPTVATVTAQPANLDVGQSTDLNVTLNGGSSPLAYSWSSLPSGCSSADTPDLVCRPTGTGTFDAIVSLRDAVGGQANGSVSFSVAPQLSVKLAVSPAVRDLGGSVTFTATIAGGQTPYDEAYTGLPSGCASADTATLTCTPTALGTFSVTAMVRDSVGSRVSAVASLDVVGAPNATLSVTPSTVDLGQSVTFVAAVSGGTGTDQYAYANLPIGCSGGNVSTFTCTPTAAGSDSVVVTITDSDGVSATATTVVTINPALAITINANVTSGLTPLAVSFAANLSGGTAPFQYSWRFAPNASSNLSTPQFVFFTAGNYSVSLTITDAVGSTLTTQLPIRVAPTSNLLTYSISFFVNPSGCGPITLDSFLLRDGSTESLPAATYPAIAPSCPGFAFTQWVPSGNLIVHGPANASTDITVAGSGSITAVLTAIATHGSAPTGGFSIRSLASWAPYLPLLIGAVLALYVIVHYLDGRRAERKPSEGTDGGTPAAPPPRPEPRPAEVPNGALGVASAPAPARPSAPAGGASPPKPISPSAGMAPPYRSPPIDRTLPTSPPTTASPPPAVAPSAARPVSGYPPRFTTAAASDGSPPPLVRSPIAPPPPRTGLPPVGVSMTPPARSEAPSAGATRSWPPSRIWDISPTPNSPKKPESRRLPPDGP